MIAKNLEKILNNFHRATDLNLYVFKNHYKQIRKYTSPLAPNFPLSLLKELDNASNKLNLILFNNQCAMGFFNINDLTIIGLNLNFTIANNKNYDRLAPLLGWNKFSQTMKCLYFMVFNKWPIIAKSTETFSLGENISLDNEKKTSYKGYLIETELMKAVSKGNLDEYNDIFKKLSSMVIWVHLEVTSSEILRIWQLLQLPYILEQQLKVVFPYLKHSGSATK